MGLKDLLLGRQALDSFLLREPVDLTSLLPRSLIRDTEFRKDWMERYAKSEAFAKLFGINPEAEGKPEFYKGKELTKQEIHDILVQAEIMKPNNLSKTINGIIKKGIFPNSYYSWYQFTKVTNPQGQERYRLEWMDEAF